MLAWCGIPSLQTLADEAESLFKGIDLGPGKLDLRGSLRLRYEYFDNYNIKTYGNHKADTTLLSRLRINLGYRLPQRANIFIQLQDAQFFSPISASTIFGASCPYENSLDCATGLWRNEGNRQHAPGFQNGGGIYSI